MLVEVGHVQNPGTNVPVGVQRLEAAIEPGKADAPVQNCQLENSLSLWEGLDFYSM